MKQMHIGIVGSGVVGACCALLLSRQDCQVSLIDPAPAGGPQAASHGNGGWISPASVVPMSMPGLWKKIPGYLLDPQGPLTLRWTSLPGLLPWLLKFLWAGHSMDRVRVTAGALHALLHDAPERHREFAQWAQTSELLHSQGLLYAYPDQLALKAEANAWSLRQACGVVSEVLDAQALRRLVPDLSPAYQCGVWVPSGAWCSDPGNYVRRLADAAVQAGVHRVEAQVERLRLETGRCTGVVTSRGELSFDHVVIAAGIRSPRFAHQAGDTLPMASERGYHVVLPHAGFTLPLPVMPSDGRMANTPTVHGLRLAGQVELAHPDAPPNWARADVLLQHAQRTYPQLKNPRQREGLSQWMGHRPSTPDGLPVIGPSPRCQGLWYACGHGHVGLASAPRTAEWLLQGLTTGQMPAVSASGTNPYGIERFE